MFIGQHVDFVLHGHRQPQELVSQVRRTKLADAFGVWDLVAGDGSLVGQLERFAVELLEGDGVQVMHFLGMV